MCIIWENVENWKFNAKMNQQKNVEINLGGENVQHSQKSYWNL